MKPSEWIRERANELAPKHPRLSAGDLEREALIEFLDFWQHHDRTNGFLADLRRCTSAKQAQEIELHRMSMERISKELEELYDDD